MRTRALLLRPASSLVGFVCVAWALAACRPTAGYHGQAVAESANSSNPPPPSSEQESSGNVQSSPPPGSLRGGTATGPADAGPRRRRAPDAPQCTLDADCVRETCCHATRCVPRDRGPSSCADAVCTQECAPDSLDCGGSCGCEAGLCVTHRGHPVPGLQ